ncbi:DUF4199 domain-containing protein [Draconibacterium sp. IB214405]|uniref:DUF4199 domain-containing protein n=1 Tax=Draconibacterium sp. IB214405 TaxID=3097352 RepID=UPI002A151E97|nr:DUF4199 domain-containing protein [Draconibacterium sp. IB214405]MDX8339094.1 DUF4199 domain-containing protein [Draconibacterium sp. IB214405]
MEQKSSPLLKSSLTYGIYAALISIFISVVIWAGGLMESMGIFGSAIIGVISLVISFVVMLVFTKNYRNKEFEGYISFSEAFKFALLVSVVSTIILVVYNFIFHSFIAPDYIENLYATLQQKTLEYMESRGVPDAAIEQTLERFEDVPTIAKTIRQTVLSGLIGGAIISLIVAAIAKKKVEDSY